MKDLLQNIIKFHVDRLFLEVTISRLLIDYESLTRIVSDEKFMAGDIIHLSINIFCSSLPAYERYHIIYNCLINLEEKEITVKKDLINILMMSTKSMVLPKEVSSNDFPNKRYNYIISLYRKYNLSVYRIELEALINLT